MTTWHVTINPPAPPSQWPDATNTGPLLDTDLLVVGVDISTGTGWHARDIGSGSMSVSIDAEGVELDGLDIPGGVYNPAGHGGVQITNSRARLIGWADGSYGINIGPGSWLQRVLVGGGVDGNTRVRSSGITVVGATGENLSCLIEEVEVRKTTHCIHHSGGYTTVRNSWLHDVSMGDDDVPGMAEDHTETVFVFEGQHITYQHCRLQSGNSAVFFAQNNAGTGVGTGNLLINRCWFEANPPRNDQWSNAAIIIENKTIAGPVVVTNNLIDGPAIGTAFPFDVWEVGLAGEVPADVSTVTGNKYPDGSSADGDFSFTAVDF